MNQVFMNDQLINLINNTPYISTGDKGFLLDKIQSMSPLEKLKLEYSLKSGQAPSILQQLQVIRARFFQQEKDQQQKSPIDKLSAKIIPQKAQKSLSISILTQPQILGGTIPQAIKEDNIKPLNSLSDFYHPFQLSMLTNQHVSFNINDNVEQIIQNFIKKTEDIFNKIDNINLRRSYFMGFLQSQLYSNYVNTGLTALKHPELEPAKIILNLLYQISPNYLNSKQFSHAATISSHIRTICAI